MISSRWFSLLFIVGFSVWMCLCSVVFLLVLECLGCFSYCVMLFISGFRFGGSVCLLVCNVFSWLVMDDSIGSISSMCLCRCFIDIVVFVWCGLLWCRNLISVLNCIRLVVSWLCGVCVCFWVRIWWYYCVVLFI